MGLIKCKECGKEISDKAMSCPNCGCPIENTSDVIIGNLSTNENNKQDMAPYPKKRGCATCLTFLIAFFIVCGVIISFILLLVNFVDNPNSESNKGYAEKYIGVSKEAGEAIDNILAQCGLNNIDSIQHDDLLDNLHFEGEKGYTVETSEINNIKLYLYADDVVYAVRYADNDLFLKGDLISTINDYTMTIDEQTDLMLRCEKGVKAILKSPSTAKFPNILEWRFSKNKEIVIVQSYVDSQNGFGAEIRSEFQFTINTNNSTIESFIFDGQELMNQ